MGTFVFSGGDGSFGFNMLEWNAGDIVNLVANTLSTSHSSTQVTYSSAGEVMQARGSLGGYDTFGDPTSGTVTSFTYSTLRFGVSSMSIAASNISVSVPSLFTWIFNGDALALHHFLFDGADTMTGSNGGDILEGYGGGDTINGGNGDDIVFGENFPGDEVLTSAPGADTINGGEGDDTLFGQGGNDNLSGGNGLDWLIGGIGNDTLNGGAGEDTALYADATTGVSVSLAAVGQQNTGGAGLDTLSAIENLFGSLFNDTLTGDSNANVIAGSDGNDVMDGGGGVDTVSYADALSAITVSLTLSGQQNTGGGGLDTLSNFENFIGSDFNDTVIGNAVNNSFDGGLGSDTVSYIAALAGVSVSLALTAQQNTVGAGLDTLIGVENLTGSAHNDTLTGSDAANIIDGGGGADSIDAGDGADTVISGGGGDTLDGGAGSDLLRIVLASSASTTFQTSTLLAPGDVTFGDGTVVRNFEQFDITAGSGDDIFVIDSPISGAFAFSGGGGVDRLVADFSASAGPVTMDALNLISFAGGTIATNVEQYWIIGSADLDNLHGGAGHDEFTGANGGDFLSGNAGGDLIDGGEGDDFLFSAVESPTTNGGYYITYPPILDSGAEVDTLIGGLGDDHFFAGYGDNVSGGANGAVGDVLLISFMGASEGVIADFRQSTLLIGGGTISGIETVEWVEGSNFGDTIILSGVSPYSRFPLIYGMGGDDTLVGDYYTDEMYGGDGNDIVDGRSSQYLHSVDGGDGNDTLYTNANTFALAYGGAGNDTIYAHGEVHGGDGADLIVLSSTYYLGYVYGDAGDDEIRASGFGRIIEGGAGNDLFVSGEGDDNFDGGADFDSIADFRNATGAVTINLQAGTASGASIGADTLINVEAARGGSGADNIQGNGGANTLSGAGGADSVNGGDGGDTLYGDAGNDTLNGGNGADAMSGGDDADSLNGGDGGDTLNGDAGNDTLNGGTGADAMFGGDGDDTIYWDASDDLANVQGGAGTDTLVFSGAAPTGFGLGAHGFEAAEERLTDTASQPWATRTLVYDALWRLDAETTGFDDGSHAFHDYDQTSQFGWSDEWTRYDALDRVDVIVTTFDDASYSNNNYDEADGFVWSSEWTHYDALNRVDTVFTTFDDATYSINEFDVAAAQAWSSQWTHYDGLDRVDTVFTTFDDGSYSINEFDVAGAQPWATQWTLYDELDRVDTIVTTYDDGSYAINDYDQANQFSWASQFWLYNSSGQVVAYQLIPDGGG